MNSAWTTSDQAQKASETRRSNTIPLPRSHVPRTDSEVQLHEDMAVAEWKDLCMFYRVVNGIRERQNASVQGGVQIAAETFESTSDDQQNPMDASVSLYASSNEFALHDTTHRERAEGFLNEQRTMMLTSVTDDGWSISGYEDMDNLLPVVEADEAPEDDGVFCMEL